MPESLDTCPADPRLAVERVRPVPPSSRCEDCALRVQAQAPVMPEDSGGGGGTVLVVAGPPGSHEAASGRPLMDAEGARLRAVLRRAWPGRIVLDSAVRCRPARGTLVSDDCVKACRYRLAGVLEQVRPERVLALGDEAVLSVLGRSVNLLGTRRGYAWLWNGGKPVPVFLCLGARVGARNPVLRKYLLEDAEWALRAVPPPPRHLLPGFAAAVVTSPEDARAAVESLSSGEGFAFDLEYAGRPYGGDFRLLCVSASPVGVPAAWVWDEDALADAASWGLLAELLADPDVPKGGSNVKVDLHGLLAAKGLRVRGVVFDTRLRRKMLEPEASGALEDMAELVGMGGHKGEAQEALKEIEAELGRALAAQRRAERDGQSGLDLRASARPSIRVGGRRSEVPFDLERYAGNLKGIAYAWLEREVLLPYAALDSVATARLESLLSLQLSRRPGLQRVWDEVVLPSALAVQRMEEWGVPYDRQAGHLFSTLMRQQEAEALRRVQQHKPGLNPGSTQQLARVLYEELGLGLRKERRTDGGAMPTDEEALTELAPQHPLPKLVLEYRHCQKFAAYPEEWERCVDPDGRIRPSILLDGARSGRASAVDPALMTVPRAADSEDGKRARDCFAAPPRWVMVQFDHSQIELRGAVVVSHDDVMAALFRSGVDFHMGTARLISKLAWGIEPDAVTKVHRTGAKTVNFSLAFDKSIRTLAEDLHTTREKAQAIQQAIFGKFKRFAVWREEARAQAVAEGGCWTVWEDQPARFRPLWRIADQTEEGSYAAGRAKRGGINTPIQGTSSDVFWYGAARVVRAMAEGEIQGQAVLPVHDSLLCLFPESVWEAEARKVRDVMQDVPWVLRHVPLVVDVEAGPRWGSLVKVTL